MKKTVLINVILIVIFLSCSMVGFSQSSKQGMPPFKIRLVDGSGFTAEQLTKDKPTILVYFSPTCEECKEFTAAMSQRLSELSAQQIVMITYEDINSVIGFDQQFQLSKHKNIKIGSEGYTFIVQKYYNIRHFPFVAKFDKNGKLLKILSASLTPKQKAAAL